MCRCLAIIICGLMGILSPKQAVGAEKPMTAHQMATAIAHAKGKSTEKEACSNCTKTQCEKPRYRILKLACDDVCGGCTRPEDASSTAAAPSVAKQQSKAPPSGAPKLSAERAEELKSLANAIKRASHSEVGKACKDGCTPENCEVPTFKKFCQKRCKPSPCGGAADINEGKKHQSQGPSKEEMNAMIGKIQNPKTQQIAQEIYDADDDSTGNSTKDNLCHHNCSSRACKADKAFGVFCVNACKPAKVINCSKELGVDELKKTGKDILNVQPAYRKAAQAISESGNLKEEGKFKPCSACTEKSCKDEVFRDKFCLMMCPKYTTLACGKMALKGYPSSSSKDLFKYYHDVSEARKASGKLWLKFENGLTGRKTEKNTYKELNELWNVKCTRNACMKDPPTTDNPYTINELSKAENPSIADVCIAYRNTPYLIVRSRGKAFLGKTIRSETLGIGADVIPNGNLQCTREALDGHPLGDVAALEKYSAGPSQEAPPPLKKQATSLVSKSKSKTLTRMGSAPAGLQSAR